MDKCREQFEEYATRYHGALNMGVVGVVYSNQAVQHDWFLWQQAWQASRQALVVQLPLWRHSQGAQVYWPEEVRQSLEDAGVKWKS